MTEDPKGYVNETGPDMGPNQLNDENLTPEEVQAAASANNADGADTGDSFIEGEVVDEELFEGASADNGATTAAGTITIPEEEYNKLVADLDQAMEQSKNYFDGWQRERADFNNYKRRIERDQQMASQNMTIDLVKRHLPVLDDIERALKNRPTEGAAATWSDGIELIYRKLQNILEAEGVKRIPAEAETFNPMRHEAISYEESPDHEGGQIIEVVQQGYTLGERVLRPALVRVARD